MGASFFPHRTVEDAAIDLVRAADRLRHHRVRADRVVDDLEARWAANRAARD
jgi:hypothetical protein